MLLSIIILNYNTPDLTINCINSIYKLYKKEIEDKEVEIILVDNKSTDDSLNLLRKQDLKIKLIESTENLGFSKGSNLGADKASGEYLLFLNSDTKVENRGFLKMIEYMKEDSRIGILGGRLINPDKSVQKSCGKFYNLFNLLFVLLGFERIGFLRFAPKISKKVDWVSGASLMIKNNIFSQIGKFDKDLFMYMEDQELCFRAKRQGFDTYYYKDIEIVHKERASSNRTFAILEIYKGIKLFYKKHKSPWQYLIALFLLKTKAIILVVLGKIVNNKYLVETYLKALKI